MHDRPNPATQPEPPVAGAEPIAKTPEVSQVTLKPTLRVKARPKLFLLAIGVSEYRRKEYKLDLPSKDARDFTEAMSLQRGVLYDAVEVRVLLDGKATKASIKDHLKWLTSAPGANDVAMLFLAGHGLNDRDGTYYFLPHDAEEERLKSTAVSESAIRDALRTIKGKALFFVDTCHAGNAVGSFKSASREIARLANNLASAENGVVIFASSTGKQLSEERLEWGNGAFTKALIAGLRGAADLLKRGIVTFKALDYFISEEVRKLTNGRQTPVTIVPIGVPDFTLASVR